MLVDFHTAWDAPCKKNDRNLWPDPDVQQLINTQTVALKINADAEQKLAGRHHVGTFPSMLLIKPDGTEIDRIVGKVSGKDA